MPKPALAAAALALAAAAVALVLVLVLASRTRPTAAIPAPAPDAEARAARPQATLAAGEPVEPPRVARSVALSSSLGIELVEPEELCRGEWRALALESGAARVHADATHVRVAGHVAQALGPDARAVVLEPGDALTVAHEDLAARLAAVRVRVLRERWTEPGGAVAWGLDAHGAWHLALDRERVDSERTAARAELVLGPHSSLFARLRRGSRGRVEPELVPSAPLELAYAPGEAAPESLVVGVWGVHERRTSGEGDWGSWTLIESLVLDAETVVGADGGTWPDVPLGTDVRFLVEHEDGIFPSYVAADVEHDGAPWTLHVADIELSGALVLPLGARGHEIDVRASLTEAPGAWASERFDADGRSRRGRETASDPPWLFRLPLRLHALRRSGEPPGTMRVVLDVSDQQAKQALLRETFEVSFAAHQHLGALVIEGPLPDLVLGRGHRMPDDLTSWSARPLGTALSDERAVVSSEPGADGELRVFLRGGFSGGEHVVLRSGDDEGVLFERGDEGRWKRVRSHAYRVRLAIDALPAGAHGVHVGWFFGGREHWLAWIDTSDVPLERELAFHAPADHVELWWARGSRRVSDPELLRPGEGSVALAAPDATVRIP